MGKYPSFKEFQSKPAKGIQRCDELLKKSPNDVQLLITKLQLESHISSTDAATQTLHRLLEVRPAVQSLQDVATIEQAVIDLDRDVYPVPPTAGPDVAKLWDNAAQAAINTNHKLDIHSLRLTRAIIDSRLGDAQQALIQLKALTPKNRSTYMAHLALTQLLSKSNNDLQARLALMLARKAVKENFDDDKQLDCRVPGQVFALQNSEKDLESIQARRFADSKEVFRAARRHRAQAGVETIEQIETCDPASTSTREWLLSEVASLKRQFQQICSAQPCDQHELRRFVTNAIRSFVLAISELSLKSARSAVDLMFLAISALIKLWTLDQSTAHLLRSAFLAESLLSYQPRVHEAKVFLVYVYTRLGLVSLAAKEWDELSVKGIQFDTVGHVFMTRLSLAHPHAFRSNKMKETRPPRILAIALDMYGRTEDTLAENQAGVLNHRQTGMIFDTYQVRDTLRRSVTLRIMSLENRRLARLTGRALDDHFVHVTPQSVAAWLDMRDSRDFTTTFDYGFATERAVYGEGDVKPWILFGLAADSAWCLMHGAYPAVKDTSALLEQLEGISARGFASDAEFIAGNLSHLILRAVFEIGGASTTGSQRTSAAYLEAINALNSELLTSECGALPIHAKTISLYLDALRLVVAFSKFAESKKAFTREQGLELRTVADKTWEALQTHGKKQTTAIGQDEIEVLLDVDMMGISAVLKPLGRDHLVSFTARITESSKDAWSGPAHIKA